MRYRLQLKNQFAPLSPFAQLLTTVSYSAYAVLSFEPDFVLDFTEDYYQTEGVNSTFEDSVNFTRAGNATMVDSDGVLKWAPHNLLKYSGDLFQIFATPFGNVTLSRVSGTSPVGSSTTILQVSFTSSGALAATRENVTLDAGVQYTFSVWVRRTGGTGSLKIDDGNNAATTISGLSSEWVLASHTFTPASSSTWIDLETDVSGTVLEIDGGHLYRSDLSGMVDNPDRGDSYVPTTSDAVYLPRRNHHVWNGSEWVNEGLLIESESRVQLLHTTDALVTQSKTVSAVPHTLHFTGTGTVTLSGASTAGLLVGTGTGEQSRVSLTFTPTAGTLMLTVSGTVTNAQLETGSTPSSYIPNLAGSGEVTRAAETLTVPAANLPWSSEAVSIQMEGRITYAASTSFYAATQVRWRADANNFIDLKVDILLPSLTGQFSVRQRDAGTNSSVKSSVDYYSPGILVPFNFASRHGSTFINGAVDGTALTADTTPTALADLSTTDLTLGYDFMGTIKKVRIWADDITDAGIAEASA